MKKLISLSLILVILTTTVFTFSSCSGKAELNKENIEYAVTSAEAALKAFDTEQLEKYVDSKTLSVIIPFAEKNEAFQSLGKAMFENLEIKIVNADVMSKTVTVKVINKDLYAGAAAFAYNLNTSYSKMELLGLIDNQSFIDSNLTPLIEQIDAAQMKSDYEEVVLTVKEGKHNLVLSFDEEAENAVSGGALGAIKSVFGV